MVNSIWVNLTSGLMPRISSREVVTTLRESWSLQEKMIHRFGTKILMTTEVLRFWETLTLTPALVLPLLRLPFQDPSNIAFGEETWTSSVVKSTTLLFHGEYSSLMRQTTVQLDTA